MFYLVQLLVQIEFRYLFPVHRRGLELVSGGIIQIGVLLMISFRTETVHLINIQWIHGRELYTRPGILEFWNSDTVSGQMAHRSSSSSVSTESQVWGQHHLAPVTDVSPVPTIPNFHPEFWIEFQYNWEVPYSTELQSTIVPYPGFYSNLMKQMAIRTHCHWLYFNFN